ncbi:hypothetical protein [Mangrovibacterium sp.]|uniref:hypothetical protein n=1 Tax=Mangrovibacterium sp. TaxID=1961364 RepID=UPI003568BF85
MKFAAHLVVTAKGDVLPKGIVELDKSGVILEITANENGLREQAGMEFHSGIICPAFPNLSSLITQEELFGRLPELKPFERYRPASSQDPKFSFNWMKNIQIHEPDSSLVELIALFTARTASVLGLNEAGTLEVGKRPGLVVLSGIDYSKLRLSEDSRLKKLI